MCISGKLSYDEQDAKRHSKKKKWLKRFYYCEHCEHYHVTSQSSGKIRNTNIKDMLMNELLIGAIQKRESEFIVRISNAVSYHLVTLSDVSYIVTYNKVRKTCKYERI